jgi:hypothetical protein
VSLDYFSLGHPLSRVRSHFAVRARRRMIAMFREALAPGPEDKVLDLGVTPDSSLPESNLFEAIYPWRQRVTAASIEDAAHLERVYPGVGGAPHASRGPGAKPGAH